MATVVHMTTTSPEALAAETLAEALVAAVRCPEYTAHAEKMIGVWAREPLLGCPFEKLRSNSTSLSRRSLCGSSEGRWWRPAAGAAAR